MCGSIVACDSLGRRQKKTVTLSERVEPDLRLGHTDQLLSWLMRGLAVIEATWQIKLVCGTKY